MSRIAGVKKDLESEKKQKVVSRLKAQGYKRVTGYSPPSYKETEDKVKSVRNKAMATHSAAGAALGAAGGAAVSAATKPKTRLGKILSVAVPAVTSAIAGAGTSRSINDNKKVKSVAQKTYTRNKLVEHKLEHGGKYDIYKKTSSILDETSLKDFDKRTKHGPTYAAAIGATAGGLIGAGVTNAASQLLKGKGPGKKLMAIGSAVPAIAGGSWFYNHNKKVNKGARKAFIKYKEKTANNMKNTNKHANVISSLYAKIPNLPGLRKVVEKSYSKAQGKAINKGDDKAVAKWKQIAKDRNAGDLKLDKDKQIANLKETNKATSAKANKAQTRAEINELKYKNKQRDAANASREAKNLGKKVEKQKIKSRKAIAGGVAGGAITGGAIVNALNKKKDKKEN